MPDRPGDMDERDVNARFASIIARWEGPVPAPADPEGAQPAETVADDVAADDVAAEGGAVPDEAAAEEASPPPESSEPATPEPTAPRAPWVNPSPLDVGVPSSAWRAAEPSDPATEAAAAEAEAALDEEHFEPPPVSLPPQEDLHFWGAVIGLVAGPLMLLYVVFARPFHSTRWFVAAVVVSLLGFALLILRQPSHRDPSSGDNGARV